MTTDIFKEEEGVLMFFDSQFHETLYSNTVSINGESKKRRRRKKNKEDGGDVRKRKLTAQQVNSLEYNFSIDHNLETQRKLKIAAELALEPQQVAIWFQNRRVRYRYKMLEMEYYKLKSAHEGVVVEKSILEQEVIKLKAQLSEAQKEMKRLEERSSESFSSSHDSSLSIDPDTYFLKFPMEGSDYLSQYDSSCSSVYDFDWANIAPGF
ncbi:hypothetical protein ACHQM5_023210 [Ranunculus cassubicifolius]